MNILAIESSCDETAAAVVKDGVTSVCGTIATSKELHEKTGGIVPEVAARKQVEFIVPVISDTLEKFEKITGLDPYQGIDAIAVTIGPGLIGSLIVGIESAKALSFVWEKPLIPVNHLIGHLYANFIDNPESLSFPMIGLVVSGGHTDIILMRGHYDFEYLGGTLDDAAGEAFDKTARLLGISKYLGGAKLSKLATEYEKDEFKGVLPRPMITHDSFDFSFSGLKTAVKRFVELNQLNETQVKNFAFEFENAVVDVLVSKTIKAALKHNVKTIILGGGVSANTKLRQRMQTECEKNSILLNVPPFELCTDNAVYIAGSAYFLQQKYGIDKFKNIDYSNIKANPSLDIMQF